MSGLWMIVDESWWRLGKVTCPQFVPDLSGQLIHRSSSFDGLDQDMKVIIESPVLAAELQYGPAGV